MRILGVTETCDLGSMYMRLLCEGHEVKVSVSEPLAQGTMLGLVPHVENWRDELDWLRTGPDWSAIVFEAVGFGRLQDQLRSEGFNVVGGSEFGDRLENDRAFALSLLQGPEVKLAPTVQFDDVRAALGDLKQRPRRCAYKRCDSQGDTFVGTFDNGEDVAAFLANQSTQTGTNFILMDHVTGVETGVGAFFNGERFVRPACLDWEHKRFFPGNMGELTGEMGTVTTFDGADRLFEATLLPLEALFAAANHVGWINLNTIINEQGVWPLEFTCRFGYPGFAALEPLQDLSWSELLTILIEREEGWFATKSGFSTAVVLTTPPMPLSRKEVAAPVGLPIAVGSVPRQHLHLGEVGLSGSHLVTSGLYGWTAVVTGKGETLADAQSAAYAHAAQVQAPNLRYRSDIGDALIGGEIALLKEWGWLNCNPSERIASQIVR